MIRLRFPYAILFFSFFITIFVHAVAQAEQSATPLTLRVALYPYVPDRAAILDTFKQDFEASHPDIQVTFVTDDDFTDRYYKGGLQRTKADVYEVDTILLADMIDEGRIAEIGLPDGKFLPEAIAAVTRDGKIYGVPHWVCGNFLFYRTKDHAIGDAKTWLELLVAIAQSGKSLLVDLKGSSGLGEWYFTALADRIGVEEAQKSIASGASINRDVLSSLIEIDKACPSEYCRIKSQHDETGFYPRLFAHGGYAAYIGYSESLHYGLQEIIEHCSAETSCLAESEIIVRRLPPFGLRAGGGVGWVDALTISRTLEGPALDAAKKFVRFIASKEEDEAVLSPKNGAAPRYLLPARADVAVHGADLYPALLREFSGRATGFGLHLNDELRSAGSLLDCELPWPATDTNRPTSCPARP